MLLAGRDVRHGSCRGHAVSHGGGAPECCVIAVPEQREDKDRALRLRAAVMGCITKQGWPSRGPWSDARLCAGMRGKLPDVVKLPPSVTVPFSSFEEALKQKENKAMAKRLEAAVKAIPQTNAEERLRECRDIVMEARHRPCSNSWTFMTVCWNERTNLSALHFTRQGFHLCKQEASGHGCMLTL